MSTTIGFGICTAEDCRVFNELKILARKYGYGLLNGIEFAESDARAGLDVMKINDGWSDLFFLQSPIDADTALAFGIHEELIALETNNTRPVFFQFLTESESLLSSKCSKVGIFFAGEWYAKDRVKYSYGTIGRLIDILSLPGSWGVRYMIPESGQLQDSDETPFVFNLDSKS